MEQELFAGLGEGQIAQFVQHDEVRPREVIGDAALPAGVGFGLQFVDQIGRQLERRPSRRPSERRPSREDVPPRADHDRLAAEGPDIVSASISHLVVYQEVCKNEPSV